jgi:hypothetical protein
MKNKNIVKRFSFSDEEKRKLDKIHAGIEIAEATSDGLHIYKNALLAGVYKRCGIDGEPRKGYSKSIRYNLRENLIEYTEAFIEKKDGKN